MAPCPLCGAPARVQHTYKHEWACCARCGNASRQSRPQLPVDLLPARLSGLLPAALRRDLRDTQDAWFSSLEEGTPPHEGEVGLVERLLAAYQLDTSGAILDVGGGPGLVAAHLQRGARRVVLLEHARGALAHARKLGVDARSFDFDGPALETVVDGPFDLLLCRFALNWCVDLPRLARSLAALARPGAAALLCFTTPTRGAVLTSMLEDAAPRVLWSPPWVESVFGGAGWSVQARLEPIPPMPYTRPHGPGWRLFALPWGWLPGPLPRDLLQRHAGLVLTRAG